MDYTKALDRNRDALAAILLALGAMLRAGISGTGRITKILRRIVLRRLMPAESAVRRLIIIAARGMKGPSIIASWDRGRPWPGYKRPRRVITRLAFPLFDTPKYHLLKPPPKPAPRGVPRIRSLFGDPNLVPLAAPSPPPPLPDPTIDARRLRLRFEALERALNDLPGQARRLVRERVRRSISKKRTVFSPLRPGHAPGHRKHRRLPVHDILDDCQYFAKQVLADTS